jgi:hypothetical protein
MKRIHFDNLEKNRYWGVLIIFLSLTLILVEELPFELENPKAYNYLRGGGFLLQALFWSKLFFGKSLRFDDVKSTELNEKTMTITNKSGQKITLNLNEFVESDNQKLNEIMIKNTIANTT